MKRRITVLFLLTAVICMLFCSVSAEAVKEEIQEIVADAEIIDSILSEVVEEPVHLSGAINDLQAPTNVRVSPPITVGKPYTVTWDGNETNYEVVVYDSEQNELKWNAADGTTNMVFDVFRLMPGTYTAGVFAYTWDGNAEHRSDVVLSTPFTVAASEKTWDYQIIGGKVKIVAYYGNETDVTVPGTLGGYPVTAIESYTFCGRNISSITLPDSVNEIASFAFDNSTLRSITVGANVRVNEYAFNGCNSGLTVTGKMESDAQRAAETAGVGFVSNGSIPAAPTARRNKDFDTDYDWYFSVSDPDAERYEYKVVHTYSDWDYTSTKVLDVFYTGQEVNVSIYYDDSSLQSVEVSFRALKNGEWSAWTDSIIEEKEEQQSTELDFENAIPLTNHITALNVEGDKYSLIKIQPEISEEYTFTSDSTNDTFAILYDAQGNTLFTDDDSGENYNFLLSYDLTAGSTYYLGVRFFNRNNNEAVPVITECSRFASLPAPAMTVDINDDGDYVINLESDRAESFRLRVKTVFGAYYNTAIEIVSLNPENGRASFVLRDPGQEEYEGYYYEVCASIINGDDLSGWTDPTILKAVYEGEENGFQWKTDSDGNISILNYTGNEMIVTVPSQIQGHPVTNIGRNAFSNNNRIRKVVLSEGIREIGDASFSNCNSLYAVMLPETVEVIGERAFENDWKLIAINIPSGLKRIGYAAFLDCNAIKWLSFPSNSDIDISDVFAYCDELVIEADYGSSGWMAAASNGHAFTPLSDNRPTENLPVMTVSDNQLLYYGGYVTVEVSMPGAEEFRILTCGDHYEFDYAYHQNYCVEDIFDANEGKAEYSLYGEYDCLSYGLLASAKVDGEWTPWTDVLMIKPQYKGKLATPQPAIDGTVTAGEEYRITWPAVDGATGYEIAVWGIAEYDTYFAVLNYESTGDEIVSEGIWKWASGTFQLTARAYGNDGWLESETYTAEMQVAPGNGDDYLYSEEEYRVVLTDYIGALTTGEVSIPSQINGKPVTGLAGALFKSFPARGFIVPETVTRVDEEVFNNCRNLETVVFNGPVTLEHVQFWRCYNLKTLEFRHPGAYASGYALDPGMIMSDYSLLMRGYSGTDLEEMAYWYGWGFESIGTLPECLEFTLTCDVEREDGIAYPGDTIRFMLVDSEAEEVQYKLNYTILSLPARDNSVTGTVYGTDGVFETTFNYYEDCADVKLCARVFKEGSWTLWSDPVSLGYTDERLPQVTGVQVESDNGKVNVSWNPVENASEYMVYFCWPGSTSVIKSTYVYGATTCTCTWLEDTANYDIYAVASVAANRSKLRGVWSEKVTALLEKDTRTEFFDVSANEGIFDISPVTAFMYAKGATNIKINYLNTDNGGQENNYGNCGNAQWDMNLPFAGTITYIAYASYNYGDDWTEIGRQTVTMSYLGELDKPVVHTDPYIREGQDLTILIDAVENAERYELDIYGYDPDDYTYRNIVNKEVQAGQTVTIPAAALMYSEYMINATGIKTGYHSNFRSMFVKVMPETVREITLSADRDEYWVGESCTLTVNAPEATCILFYRNGSADDYEYPDSDGVCTLNSTISESGATNWFVRAYYGDTEDFAPWDESLYDGPSNIVTTLYKSMGHTALPDINAAVPTEKDPFITVTIQPTDIADAYRIYLYENGDNFESLFCKPDPDHPLDALTVSYPDSLLRNGHTYTIGIWAERTHYEDSYTSPDGFSYTKAGTEEEKYFITSSEEGIVDLSPVTLLVHADGADYIRISYISEDGEIYSWNNTWNDTLRYELSSEWDHTVFIAYASYDNGETLEEIGRQTVTMSYLGSLEESAVYADPYLPAGEDLVISVEAVEHMDYYTVTLYDMDTWNYILDSQKVFAGESITVPASRLTGTRYRVYGWTYGAGYNGNFFDFEPITVLQNAHTMSIPTGTVEIKEEAFAGTAADVIRIPSSVKTIGSRAFAYCSNLKVIYIPGSVTYIADDAFEGCGELGIVTAEDSTAYKKFDQVYGFTVVLTGN